MEAVPAAAIAGLSPSSSFRRGLHLFAMIFVAATLLVIISGGRVTSQGAGLAVPDWPTTFEYNMFTYPMWAWTGGVYYEHVHRLKGSVVGLMTIVLAVWLWRTQKPRPWLRWMGVALIAMVLVQGLMGGLRVIYATGDFTGVGGRNAASEQNVTLATTLAVIHGVTGQIFLCMTVLTAAATSRWWLQGPARLEVGLAAVARRSTAQRAALVFLLVVAGQLLLGAIVRHTKSALAVPDFPLSYGHVLPPTQQATVDAISANFPEAQWKDHYGTGMVLTSYGIRQVWVAFIHRAWAGVVVLTGLWLAWRIRRDHAVEPLIRRPMLALVVLLTLQVLLGALVIWSLRYPAISTAHQVIGAVVLATAFLLWLRLARLAPGDTTTLGARRPVVDVTPKTNMPPVGTIATELSV